MTVKETLLKWSDPVRCERTIARIVECMLEATLEEAKEAWRSRIGMARALSRQMRTKKSPYFNLHVLKSNLIDVDNQLLAFFNTLAVKPVTQKSFDFWPASFTASEALWDRAITSLRARTRPGHRLFGWLLVGGPASRKAFIKMSENAGVYDHLSQLPEVAPTPRKAKRTLMQTRSDKATEAAKLWRRRLRLAKAKLEKYTKQQKYYAKKEVRE